MIFAQIAQPPAMASPGATSSARGPIRAVNYGPGPHSGVGVGRRVGVVGEVGPAAALMPASEGWCQFPNADDDCGAVRLDASKYLAEGLYRRIDVPWGVVYVHIWDLPYFGRPEDPTMMLAKARRDYIEHTRAPEQEVLVSGGTYYLASDELVIYPNEHWCEGSTNGRGALICASRAGLGRLTKETFPDYVEFSAARSVLKRPAAAMSATGSANIAAVTSVVVGASATSAEGSAESLSVNASAVMGVAATSAAGSAALMAGSTAQAADVQKDVVEDRAAIFDSAAMRRVTMQMRRKTQRRAEGGEWDSEGSPILNDGDHMNVEEEEDAKGAEEGEEEEEEIICLTNLMNPGEFDSEHED